MLTSSIKTPSISHTHTTMSKSSINPIQFIEDALFCTTPLALSYADPEQKWIIRQHLISLFQNYPSLKPSVDFFTHNNGTEVKLLNIKGELRISENAPDVPIIIWVHELYPQMAPIVFVDVERSVYPVYENHPFVDFSGCTVSSYLINWKFLKCSLLGLVRNLIKLFAINHPFYYSGCSGFNHPSRVSKTEAIDQLTCSIYYDMIAISSKTEEEIERLSLIQAELEKRGEILGVLEQGLESERENLEGRLKKLGDECDEVSIWLNGNEKRFDFDVERDGIDDAFEVFDEMSERLIHLKACDNAIEDLIYALDKGVEEGVVDFRVYLKQVRVLAREQFMHRAKVVKVEEMGFF